MTRNIISVILSETVQGNEGWDELVEAYDQRHRTEEKLSSKIFVDMH